MSRHAKHVPQSPALSGAETRRIERLLSRCPATMPDIEIRPYEGNAFGVEIRDSLPFGWLSPLRLGDQRFYADYDSGDGTFQEAGVLRATRRVRIRGMWCLETHSIGGDYADWQVGSPFRIIWAYADYLRVGQGDIGIVNELTSRITQRIPVLGEIEVGRVINWDGETETRECHAEGHCVVVVGGEGYDCLKLTSVSRPKDAFEQASVTGQASLEEGYVSRDGETLLVRSYQSPAQLAARDSLLRVRQDPPPVRSAPQTLSRDGLEFLPHYTMLTDACLRPLLAAEPKRVRVR